MVQVDMIDPQANEFKLRAEAVVAAGEDTLTIKLPKAVPAGKVAKMRINIQAEIENA